MDKTVLIEYCDMKEEIKDLRKRIDELEKKINNLSPVSDSVVSGKRGKKPLETFKVTGFPYPEYYTKKALLAKRKANLEYMEIELLELTNMVDDYINAIAKSKLRNMFRLYYLDGLTWERVALKMNDRYPKRRIAYTGDNCRKRHDRYLEKVE